MRPQMGPRKLDTCAAVDPLTLPCCLMRPPERLHEALQDQAHLRLGSIKRRARSYCTDTHPRPHDPPTITSPSCEPQSVSFSRRQTFYPPLCSLARMLLQLILLCDLMREQKLLGWHTVRNYVFDRQEMLTMMLTELTIRDVSELSYKFWDMHRDHILSSDGAAGMWIYECGCENWMLTRSFFSDTANNSIQPCCRHTMPVHVR